MAFDFPSSPTVGQTYQGYTWDGEKWTSQTQASGAVRYDVLQTLTAAQQKQARANIAVNDGNIIINGDFRINQVGYVSAAVLAAGAYGHDQWKAGASGGDYSFTQLKSSTQITIAAGKSLIQPIEDANVVGGSYILSWTGTAQARAGVNTLTPSGAYGPSPLLINGQTANTVMSIEFNTGTLGSVKLEIGASPTPFVMRPYDQELLACRRYFQNFGGEAAYQLLGNGMCISTSTAYVMMPFNPVMRAAPTMTWGGNFGVHNTTGNALAVGSITPNSINTRTAMWVVAVSGGTGLSGGAATMMFINNDMNCRMSFDARL